MEISEFAGVLCYYLVSVGSSGGVLALDLLSFGTGVALELLAQPFEDRRNRHGVFGVEKIRPEPPGM